ncbi:hypothetical protein FI667_g10532, partial [Globisporangium splendens]
MCLCGLRLRVPFLSSAVDVAAPLRKLPPKKGVPRPRHKALHHRHCRREWADGLLFSNLVYALAGFVSLSCGQYFCAVLQFGATIASTAFHRSKETKYLLVDASISSTLAVVFIYFAMHVLKNEWYGILAIKVTQGIMCIFTWLYCGLPGGERYEKWHQRWHYVSGFTTITTSLLLATYMPDFDLIMHEFIQDYMIVSKWLQ